MADSITMKLKEAGFVLVTGTHEHNLAKGIQYLDPVEKKEPMTWDANNGTVVFYDEIGEPWAMRRRELDYPRWDDDFAEMNHFKKGAYVPHSNDCGFFWDQMSHN